MQAEHHLHFAPRRRTIPLPPEEDEQDNLSPFLPTKPKVTAHREILPTDLLLIAADNDEPHPQGLHRCLPCIETRRAVITAEEIVNTLGLQENIIPMTNAPNDRVTIESIDGRTITVTPTEEKPFDFVHDINRGVVDLLEECYNGGGRGTWWAPLPASAKFDP